MCGIFGILRHNANCAPDATRLQQTADALQHRGPDARGIISNPGIGLVHTRLSLMDLNERSNQPLWDQTGRYCLVYNGELYEYEDLERRLRRRGVRFQTSSDTQVLLQALIHFGVEPTLRLLEGMFAFGFYDSRDRTLVVARDRLGIKPLYVHESSNEFIFASTPQAFRPWLTLEPNMLSAASYLLGFGGPTVGKSFYRQIEILPPASVLRIRQGGKSTRSRFFPIDDLSDESEAANLAAERPRRLVDRVDSLLLESVKSQLNADAPMGILCSGGVDSSLVAAMASRFRSELAIFHADVEGPLSECSAAAALARHFKLDFKSIRVGDSDFIERLPDVIEHYGYPFTFRAESIAVLKVAELARNSRVKAVLCGEGADECYHGYDWIAPTNRGRFRLPARRNRFLPSRLWGLTQRSGADATSPLLPAVDQGLLQGIHDQIKSELGETAFDAWQNADRRQPKSRRGSVLNGVLAYVLRTLLHRNDSLGMAASVETRFPFLSGRLLKVAENLPNSYKFRFSPFSLRSEHPFFRDKWIIRQVARRYLPRKFSQRKKRPFGVDAYQRLQVSRRFFENSYLTDLLQLDRVRLHRMLDAADNAMQLRLMQFDVWGRLCLQKTPKAEVLRGLRRECALLRRAG